jgi:hypothetical protein
MSNSSCWGRHQLHARFNRRSLHCAHPDFRVRSGRDDKFVAGAELSRRIVAFKLNLSSRPERSEVEGPAVLLPGIESRFIPRGSAKPVVNFTERRTRGSLQGIVAGNPGREMTKRCVISVVSVVSPPAGAVFPGIPCNAKALPKVAVLGKWLKCALYAL